MAKMTKTTKSIAALKVDFGTNVRVAQNYDVPAMKEAILQVGRINDAIHIRSDGTVLRGNRRTLAGQELLNDPTTPQDVADALKKVDVFVHDVVPGSPEELAIILDHGNTKGLCKTEVLLTVWRMDKQFMSEQQICVGLYQQLALYTGNQKKAVEAQAITNQADRAKFVRTWLHGTVGNYMLAGAKMGAYVREQMELSHLADDRLLPADKKVEVYMSRDRITGLSQAKSKDDVKNGGKGWTVESGGENFNAKLEEYKAIDAGATVEDKAKRPTVKELVERSGLFTSPAIRSALLVASGDQSHGKALFDLDAQMARTDMVFESIRKAVPMITDPAVKALLNAIIAGTNVPAGEVDVLLSGFMAK